MGRHAHEYIAGSRTPDDWRAARGRLVVGGDGSLWREVFEQFYRTRLELRYLKPIRILQENGTLRGEGFAIAAIQCSLIEFLESTIQGVNYKYFRKPATPGQ